MLAPTLDPPASPCEAQVTPAAVVAPRPVWPLALSLFAVILAAYVLAYTRSFDLAADEGHMFAVAQSLVKHGEFNVDHADNLQYIPPTSLGPDGHRYAKYGLGQSLAAAPLVALATAFPPIGLLDTTLLLSPLAMALTATALFLAALEIGASRRHALLTSLAFAFATPALVYAKNFYSEPLGALGYALASLGLARALNRRRSRDALLAGAGIALATLVKTSLIIVAPILLLALWGYAGGRRWRLALWACAPMLAALGVTAWFNWVRFADPIYSGYGGEGFSTFPLLGAAGLLVSPGRSLFVYAPILLAAAPGLWLLRQPRGLRWWLMGASLTLLLLHGAWVAWWGAWAWGPRLLVPTLPLLSLGLVGALRWARGRGWANMVLGVLAGLGLLIQLPGALVSRIYFFWAVMEQTGPGVNPDEIANWDPRYWMPLGSLRIAQTGNLDVAWKPSQAAPIDWAGLGLALLGLGLAVALAVIAWRGGRWARQAAVLGVVAALGLALGTLAYYQRLDDNPYRELAARLDELVPPNGVILVHGSEASLTQALWNANRSRRRMVGVPTDEYWVGERLLPRLRRVAAEEADIWRLRLDDAESPALLAEMARLGLCEEPGEGGVSPARLYHWTPCR